MRRILRDLCALRGEIEVLREFDDFDVAENLRESRELSTIAMQSTQANKRIYEVGVFAS
jgi:hypothetical protein